MAEFFSATVRTMLAGNSVRVAHLVEFQFSPTPAYFWNGSGTLETSGSPAKTWVGLHNLGSIEGLEQSRNGESIQKRYSISGSDINSQLMQLAASEDRSGYFGKLAIVWIQFFDEDWQRLDDPYAIDAGLIDGITLSREQDANGATVRTITVTAENIFYNRRTPTNGYWTDADQQQRFTGDLGLEFVAGLQDTIIPVPWTDP